LKKQFSVYLKGFEKIGIHKLASLGSELGFWDGEWESEIGEFRLRIEIL
jgi:hypothetical protein